MCVCARERVEADDPNTSDLECSSIHVFSLGLAIVSSICTLIPTQFGLDSASPFEFGRKYDDDVEYSSK